MAPIKTISKDEQVEIEKRSRRQRDSIEWFSYRRGRVTASNFGKIVKHKKESAAKRTARDILSSKTFVSAATEYGIKYESDAVAKYVEKKKQLGENVIVTPKGLWVPTWEGYGWLGASVDGDVYDEQHGRGNLEVKVIYDFKATNIEEVARERKSQFCLKINDRGHLALKENHSYFYQVQGQMAIREMKFCDFVVYHPHSKTIHVERIAFDECLWRTEILPKLESFYKTYLMSNDGEGTAENE